ncbi:hypothetical protein E2C01_055979 [Portunus trituberculatus]|uniref:Uncharacterized protein n=1 Tax=Portunus trituberculatus TaxID=210409 RepID=A0A5B7GSV5_PORTR|nr:hypothetical protein [Portunus trituberculatus]
MLRSSVLVFGNPCLVSRGRFKGVTEEQLQEGDFPGFARLRADGVRAPYLPQAAASSPLPPAASSTTSQPPAATLLAGK